MSQKSQRFMDLLSRATAVFTTIAVVLHCSLPASAASEATLEGTLTIPCDPSRVSEVASVVLRPVAGGAAVTVAVDSSTGTFRSPALPEGEYQVIAIGTDGTPLSPQLQKLLLVGGPNTVTLSMQPPGCGEPDSDGDGVPDALDSCPTSPPGAAVGADGCPSQAKKNKSLKDWHITLIFVGVVGAIAVALHDEEDPASAFQP